MEKNTVIEQLSAIDHDPITDNSAITDNSLGRMRVITYFRETF
jgi:hypothetical protein